MFENILMVLLGVITTYWVVTLFKKKEKKELTEKQSAVLLEKIKSVCKLITVEGEFAEIYHHENIKDHFLGLLSSKRKALIVINAKVHIGYDLTKLKMHANTDDKKIVIEHMPQPEVLAIEPDMKYYDIKNGLFNRFASEDLTVLNKEAKQHILDKIPESGLMITARKEALQAILMIEKIVETIDWELDYSALKIEDKTIEKLQ
ncbi:DUF4230 domain-containing protein [Formosa sp. 3Alg 14/1]|uniref:DUF4230 domain-containing protein n=1 Tax=unclassified Formosa TaxID=2644710 RepID=UPI0039BE282D